METKWKKRAMYTLAFVGCVFVTDRIGGLLLANAVKSSDIRFSRMYRGDLDAEIVFLGNSRGINGFYAPVIGRITNRDVFNLSYNGLSIESAEAIMLDYLDFNPPPRLLLIEVSMIASHPEDTPEQLANVINELKTYTGFSPRLRSLYQRHNPGGSFWCKFSHVYRYNSELFLRAMYFMNRTDQTHIPRRTIRSELVEDVKNDRYDLAPGAYIDPDHVQILERLILQLESEGIEVVLVVAPYLPELLAVNPMLTDISTRIEAALSKPHRVWDYTATLPDSSYFSDPIHPNQKGGEQLAHDMMNDGIFNSKDE